MKPRELIEFMGKCEKLKNTTRHSWTSSGRHESSAEHSWRLSLMAMMVKDEFPGLDGDKLIKMCIIHDIGEAVTGDVPAFLKTDSDEDTEDRAIRGLFGTLPEKEQKELTELWEEISERKSPEAKLWKALDNCEALMQHNEADISTWLPLEYDLQMTYGEDSCGAFDYTEELRKELNIDSQKMMDEERSKNGNNSL